MRIVSSQGVLRGLPNSLPPDELEIRRQMTEPVAKYDLGVLFVHGIGQPVRGGTLRACGESLKTWFDRWIRGAYGNQKVEFATIADATLRSDPLDPAAPASAELDLKIPVSEAGGSITEAKWLLAESWWAPTVTSPTYWSLLMWCVEIVPWTLVSHFRARLERAGERLGKIADPFRFVWWVCVWLAPAVVQFLMGTAGIPIIVLGEVVLLLFALVPNQTVRSLVGAVQRVMARTIGDSHVLLGSPMQAAAILNQVRRDLGWLSGRCNKVVMVAHSQGAAVAYKALDGNTFAKLELLMTYGSGLGKLTEVQAVQGLEQRWHAWMVPIGTFLFAVSAPSALSAFQNIGGDKKIAFVGGGVFLVAMGLVSLIVTLEMFLEPNKPPWFEKVKERISSLVMLLWIGGGVVIWLAVFWESALGILFGASLVLMMWRSEEMYELRQSTRCLLAQRQGASWLDIYASADPVPNGPLVNDKSENLRTVQVHNFGSWLFDHTAYWRNYDGFVSLVAIELTRVGGHDISHLRRGDCERLAQATDRRRWRVAWLQGARLAAVAGSLWACALSWKHAPTSWQESPEGVWAMVKWVQEQIVTVVYSLCRFGGVKACSGEVGSWSLSPMHAGFGSGIIVGLVWYLVLLLLWHWWTSRDTSRFFDRLDYYLCEPAFVFFVLILFAGVEAGVFLWVGWTENITKGMAVALVGGVASYAIPALWLRSFENQAYLQRFQGINLAWSSLLFLISVPVWTGFFLLQDYIDHEFPWPVQGLVTLVGLVIPIAVPFFFVRLASVKMVQNATRWMDGVSHSGFIYRS